MGKTTHFDAHVHDESFNPFRPRTQSFQSIFMRVRLCNVGLRLMWHDREALWMTPSSHRGRFLLRWVYKYVEGSSVGIDKFSRSEKNWCLSDELFLSDRNRRVSSLGLNFNLFFRSFCAPTTLSRASIWEEFRGF